MKWEPDRWLAISLAVIIIVAGSALSILAVQQEDAQLRADLLTDTRIAVQNINPAMVESLHGSPEDLVSPEYIALKDQLVRIRQADPAIRFAYLMGQRGDGGLFFYVDSEPPESEDYSPPGQDYTSQTGVLDTIFGWQTEYINGPYTDEWGTWVSTSVPVVDRNTGRMIAIFSMDMDARDWDHKLYAAALPEILGTLLLLAFLVSFSLIYQRGKRERIRIGQSEKAYRTIFEHTGSATVQIEEDCTISMANSRFEELSGYSRTETEGTMKWTDLVAPKDDVLRMEEYHKMRRQTGSQPPVQYQSRLLTKDGKQIDILIIVGLIPGTAKSIATLIDRTEMQELERAIRKSREQYQQLFDLAGDGILVVSDGKIQRCNAAFAAIARFPVGELTGEPLEKVIHPDDLMAMQDWQAKELRNEPDNQPFPVFRLVTKDGKIRSTEFHSRRIEWDRKPATLDTVRDITERRKIEEVLLRTNEKLNLLSSITRHDILNQIMILKGYLQLSRQHLDDREKAGTFISREMNTATTIERQILFTKDYQDMGVRAPVWQNIGMILVRAKGALPMRDVAVITDGADVEVFADPLFEKVFYNLIDNALKHGGDALTTIRVSAHETGEGLTIVFEDDGTGISDAERPMLFFEGHGKHTGFGLFLSREILSITGLTIAEKGTYGKGARFEIFVPKGAYRFAGGPAPTGQ